MGFRWGFHLLPGRLTVLVELADYRKITGTAMFLTGVKI
jgi:hypothetical protein